MWRWISRIAAALIASGTVAPNVGAGPAPIESGLREIHGAKVYLEVHGQGPPVVFLSGGMLSFSGNFAHQVDEFAAYRTVIGLEQRSQGHSPDGPWTMSYQMMADDTVALLQSLNLGPVDLIGDSDGANVALLVSRDHPELVRRVVASAGKLRSGLSAAEVARRRAWSPDERDAMLRKITASLPAWLREDYARTSPEGSDHWMAALAKFYSMWIEPVVMQVGDLRKIETPVLVMVGDHDFTTIEDAVEMARALPHGQLLVVPGAGHGKMTDRPQLVNLAIREFLDGATPP